MTRPFLTIHKWIGICFGIFLFLWLVSGIVMILPGQPMVPPGFNALPDLSAVKISPAMAAALAPGDSTAPRTVRIVGIGGRPYYEVSVKQGTRGLYDANSGVPLVITPQVAESLARSALKLITPASLGVERVEEHTLFYPFGPIPAYRIRFDDASGTIVHVAERDGSVRADTRLRRFRAVVQDLHTFEPIKLLTGKQGLRKGALHFLSVVGLMLVLTGYYLALPRRWRGRTQRGRSASP